MTIEETLAELVAIDSVSARSNGAMISYLAARAESAGFRVNAFPYVDDAGVEKTNVVAIAGGGDSKIELALVGHTDTVPYAKDWTDALKLTKRDDKLYGRGSCDTKGFISAVLTVAEGIDLESLKRPLALVFTADEEVGCLGAKHLLEARPFTARNAIVGEPTSLQPMRAGKGYCLAEVFVTGKEGHSAYPAVGASAILCAARIINRIEEIASKLAEDRREEFDPPYTTLNVGVIRGGTAKNIIPGECHFTLEWRPIPGQPASQVVDLVSEVARREADRTPGCDATVTVIRLDEAMETPADSPLVQMLERATGKRSGTVAFGTEAPQMIALGAHAVVLGPGNIREAHRTGEFVPIDELNRCAEILRQAVSHFCL